MKYETITKRQAEDSFMHIKYDATAEQDNRIVERVVESGVMAANKPAMSEEPVWVTAAKNK